MNENRSFPALKVADGITFLLHSTDREAENAVNRLAKLMSLGTATGGHRLFISTANSDSPRAHRSVNLPKPNEVQICIIPQAGNNVTMEVLQTDTIAQRIAFLILPMGGVLLHGALACINGEGVILAAPGGTGKTTASSRLPPSWESLSDDGALVIRDGNGNFFAYPWPTWSRLYNGETDCRWEVEKGVPLRAVFALCQSEEDSTEPLEHDPAFAFLIESNNQICGMKFRSNLHDDEIKSLTGMQFSAVERIIETVPVYQLNISLDGRFWDVISEALGMQERRREHPPARGREKEPPEIPGYSPFTDDKHIPIVVSGPSMLPTLRQSELLEVIPYGSDYPGPFVGDVICFFSPEKNYRVVHRVISIRGDMIVTRGDNNPSDDSHTLSEDEILGKVAFAWRDGHRRKIHGHFSGRVVHQALRIRKNILRFASPAVRTARPTLKITRNMHRYFPKIMRVRVILYTARRRRILRIFMWGKNVGEFDAVKGVWKIRYPYTFFIDSERLPKVEPHPFRNY